VCYVKILEAVFPLQFVLRDKSRISRIEALGETKIWSFVSTGVEVNNNYIGEDQQQFTVMGIVVSQ
jgi:hypothetical protein